LTPALAVFRIGLLASLRSPGLRAAAILSLVAAFSAPRVVAFAFSGADALAVASAFGTAALFAPAAALFAGVGLASGDRGGDGLAPALRGAAPAPSAVAAAAAGCAAGAAILSGGIAVAAALGLLLDHREFDSARCAGAVFAAAAAALPAAALGIALGTAAPRALAGSLAILLLGAAVIGPATAETGSSLERAASILPGPGAFLLARDAAFGDLPARAVLLSSAASVVLAGAASAAAVAILRGKDLAPRATPP